MTQAAAALLAEALWAAEIERRVAAIEAGTAILAPWDEVRRRTERDVLGW